MEHDWWQTRVSIALFFTLTLHVVATYLVITLWLSAWFYPTLLALLRDLRNDYRTSRTDISVTPYILNDVVESGGCDVEGQWVDNGLAVRPQPFREPCRECQCFDGVATCYQIECKEPTCADPIPVEGECCPVCPGRLQGASFWAVAKPTRTRDHCDNECSFFVYFLLSFLSRRDRYPTTPRRYSICILSDRNAEAKVKTSHKRISLSRWKSQIEPICNNCKNDKLCLWLLSCFLFHSLLH